MIDCADRMVLAWRFAPRITAVDLAEMLREAVFRRFGKVRAHAQGIEFLSDNGPEYTSHRFRPFVRAMGLIPCHTPRRSPQSNGLAEAFFGSFKRDYVYQACLDTWEEVRRQVPAWSDHDNREAPHSALTMQSPAECYAAWFVKNKTRPVHNYAGKNMRLALKKAAITDLHFHDLRHTCATRMVPAGVDLYKVQRLLGHKSPIMTQRYAHHYPESLRDGVEALEAGRGVSTKLAQVRVVPESDSATC
jgi:hypothetical protein